MAFRRGFGAPGGLKTLTCILWGCVWPHQYNCRIFPEERTSVKQVCVSPTALTSAQSSLQHFSHLEELHTNAGEHELQERGDDHDVPNGPDGHKHTLYHVLQAPMHIADGYRRPQ